MISEPLRNPLAMFDVKGKSALITGATWDFGRASALMLASLGARQMPAIGTADELEAVAEEARSLGASVATVNRRPDRPARSCPWTAATRRGDSAAPNP